MANQKFNEKLVESIVSDIKYLEDLGLDGGEIWESIEPNNYSASITEADIVEAFKRCGYSIKF